VREGSSAEPRDGRPPPDDAAILRQTARGDLSGFDAFVGRYRSRLISYVCQRLGDVHRAEDIAQEVFLRAFRAAARGGFRGKGSAAPWLFAIARNCVTDYLRARDQEVLPLPADATGVEGLAGGRGGSPSEDNCPAGDLLANLPEAQRDVVALKVLCGLTFAEIGEVVGCPTATAKSRMRYGLCKLRERLSRERRAGHD